MSELLYLVGFSNAGKDYIAKTQWANFVNVKLTASFKADYELCHNLTPGTCNDKSMRNNKHTYGPMTGLTISEGMVMAYKQSLSGLGFGHKYAYTTITKTIEKLAELASNRTPVVITDLRKPTELKVLQAFSEVIKYNTRMIVVHSDKSTPKQSDNSLTENIKLYSYLAQKPAENCYNNY